MSRATLARQLTQAPGWKQPDPRGQDRFSTVVAACDANEVLRFAIQTLVVDGDAHFEINREASESILRVATEAVRSKAVEQSIRSRVFFSYSRRDRKWLDELQTMLKPVVGQHMLWDDSRIHPGAKWKDEIRKSLASAKIALLLVSRNFLASDFIQRNELPPLLDAERNGGLRIPWAPVGFSMYEHTPIADYQAVHDPSRPLESLKGPARAKALVAICEKIKLRSTVERVQCERSPEPRFGGRCYFGPTRSVFGSSGVSL